MTEAPTGASEIGEIGVERAAIRYGLRDGGPPVPRCEECGVSLSVSLSTGVRD